MFSRRLLTLHYLRHLKSNSNSSKARLVLIWNVIIFTQLDIKNIWLQLLVNDDTTKTRVSSVFLVILTRIMMFKSIPCRQNPYQSNFGIIEPSFKSFVGVEDEASLEIFQFPISDLQLNSLKLKIWNVLTTNTWSKLWKRANQRCMSC